ncbi:MAG TPA: hypothetical protein VJ806_16570 [Luteimonas sp.]|nr:hypothetical protein [Luteimonas sp.]
MNIFKALRSAALALLLLAPDLASAGTDPVAPDPNTGANFNRYAYANNNPYKFVDPDGRQSRDFDSISREAGTYLKTPPPSDKDWLGPAIGVSLAVVAAPAVAYGAAELGVVAFAHPATANAVANGIMEAGAGEALGGASLAATAGAAASTLKPGPFAAESISARSAAQTFNSGERAAVNKIGQTTGCHTCGTTNPGTKSGNFVPDHQPVSSLNAIGAPQKLYPQCLTCSRQQGLEAARELRRKEP